MSPSLAVELYTIRREEESVAAERPVRADRILE